jgi:hypothetical protein
MTKPDHHKVPLDTRRFIVINPKPPFVDILLQSAEINPREFSKISEMAMSYKNDPRMIEMVRLGGDGSAKVPYLMNTGETPETILATLREIVRPHLEHIRSLPEVVQATIHLLLSINKVPKGCEFYTIPALLEIDHIHGSIIQTLHGMMADRPMAKNFFDDNVAALKQLDMDWPRLRREVNYPSPGIVLPKSSKMEYEPVVERNRVVHLYETCVIIPPPDRSMLLWFTPPVLQRPLPINETVPLTGSADWLIREVGKVGRHFTRALLSMIKTHLEIEKLSLEVKNYHLIHQEALLVLKEFVEKLP